METKDIKGITLVALVVTIIILLILSGVTISTLSGDNGIIKQSKLETEKAREKAAKEEIKKIVAEYGLASKKQTMEEFLNTKIPDRIDSVINNGDGTLTISKNGYTLTVDNVIKKDDTTTGDKTDDEIKTEPVITIGTAKVVKNSDGTGENIGEASIALGKTLYITFAHSITGGTTTVSPNIPFAVTSNGTCQFTVTGIVDGKKYEKEVSVTVNQFKKAYNYVDEDEKVTYPDGDVWVPKGFKISDDSADDVQGGIVIEDRDGNQFVWVPVADISDYKRIWYTGYNSFDKYSETLPGDEKTSVERYKGFYIGRYEAGDKESTEAKTFRSEDDITKTVTIKAGQVPYNYISQTDSVNVASEFGTKQGYKAKTKLTSGYAWDAAIEFIQKVYSDYGSNSPQGNYAGVDAFDYTDINGKKQNGKGVLMPTGQTTPVCNIYDMGGNVWEWSSEKSGALVPRVRRGGGYGAEEYSKYSSGYRDRTVNNSSDYIGFRIALFL